MEGRPPASFACSLCMLLLLLLLSPLIANKPIVEQNYAWHCNNVGSLTAAKTKGGL
jgi:hypothetical protein